MANHKSALKRARQSEVRRTRNRIAKTKIKNAVKHARVALTGEGAPSGQALQKAMSTLHKASSKGVIHPRNAARRISRLSRQFHQSSLAAQASPQDADPTS